MPGVVNYLSRERNVKPKKSDPRSRDGQEAKSIEEPEGEKISTNIVGNSLIKGPLLGVQPFPPHWGRFHAGFLCFSGNWLRSGKRASFE